MNPRTTTRRSFLFGSLLTMKGAEYLTSSLAPTNDGSTMYIGRQKGYQVQIIIKFLPDGSVPRYDATITAQRTGTVLALLKSADFDPVTRTDFASNATLNGRALLTGIGDVEGSFNVFVNGALFQDLGIAEKLATPGQQVRVVALTGARIVGK